MITSIQNNFGADTIELKDFQSPDLCILNGVIRIDPQDEAYRKAARLDIVLPQDFKMKKSAISSAVLHSSRLPAHHGTVLRCWIENGVLCIEKLDDWNQYGPIAITVASAFVTRGYRGTFEDTERMTLKILSGATFQRSYFSYKTDWVYWGAYFSDFANSTTDHGPYLIRLDGFPKDVDAFVPISVGHGSSRKGDVGSPVITGRIYGGNLYLEMDEDASDTGGDGTFLSFFAARGTLTPVEPAVENISMTTDDVTAGDGIILTSFEFSMASSPSMCCMDVVVAGTDGARTQRFSIKEYPPAGLDAMIFFLMGRGSQEARYRVMMKEIFFSRAFSDVSLTNLGYNSTSGYEVMGTTAMSYISH